MIRGSSITLHKSYETCLSKHDLNSTQTAAHFLDKSSVLPDHESQPSRQSRYSVAPLDAAHYSDSPAYRVHAGALFWLHPVRLLASNKCSDLLSPRRLFQLDQAAKT